MKGNGLWHASIACGMLLLLVECAYCMRAASIACGMGLSLVNECFYCFWHVCIPCGLLLVLVECIECLWNASIACGLYRCRECHSVAGCPQGSSV